MRTKSLLLSAAALVAGALSIQAQSNVYSVNVVGYVNLTAPSAGKYVMVANPLNAATNTLNALFATAPTGSQFLKWGGASFSSTSSKIPTGWTINYSLAPGEGGFFRTPVASLVDYTNTFVGEVVIASTNTFPAGYSIVSSSLPIATNLNVLGLTAVLHSGDQVLQWDRVAQAYAPTKTVLNPATGLWSGGTPAVKVGEAFFVRGVNAGSSWSQTYTNQ